MIKRFISAILLILTVLSLAACGTDAGSTADTNTESAKTTDTSATPETAETEAEKEKEVLDNMKTYNILFIGNSYTYFNDMPEKIFLPIAEAAGYKFNVKQLTKGGWDLVRSSSADDELGGEVDKELKTQKYDFVVLQGQSTNPSLDPGKLYDGVRALYVKVKENGAKPILYETWGRKEGSDILSDNDMTSESMTWKTAASYEAISKELGIDVAHVGLAFHDIYSSGIRRIDLYAGDLSHPSYTGSYLAAMTIFAEITGVDPTTIDYNGERAEAIAEPLREAARKAVFETPEIPAEYKTSSEGVTGEGVTGE